MNTRGFPRKFFVICAALVYTFLYTPIAILTVYSFNDNPFSYSWSAFTLEWYKEVITSSEVYDALYNSLFVALSVVILSLALGSFFVFWSSKKTILRSLKFFYGSLAIPEIVIA